MAPDPTLRPPPDILSTLETSIVQAYANSLLFLGFAIQCQRSWSKAVDAPFKLGDVDKFVKGLAESGDKLVQAADNCERHCNYLDRTRVIELRNLTEESHKAVWDQTYVTKKCLQGYQH